MKNRVHLREPVDLAGDGVPIRDLVLRELVAGDLFHITTGSVREMAMVAARLTGQPLDVISNLSPEDWGELCALVELAIAPYTKARARRLPKGGAS